MSSLFEVKFKFDTGWYDVTSKVRVTEFMKETHIYKSLKPTTDICKFKIKYDQFILSKLLLATYDIQAEILKDGQPYFRGIVDPSYKMQSTTRVEWVDIQLNDNSYILDKTIENDIQVSDAFLCDSTAITSFTEAGTAKSLVHHILFYAGYEEFAFGNELIASDSIVDVAGTKISLNYFTHLAVPPANTSNEALSKIPYGGSYKEILTNLLFQYGYVYYFDSSGRFSLFNFKETNVSPGSNVFDNTNMYGKLIVQKNKPSYDAAEISWYGQEQYSNMVVFVDDGGTSSAAYPFGNIRVEPNSYYPATANATTSVEGYYQINFEDGRSTEDIIAISNVKVDAAYRGYDYEVVTSYEVLTDKTKVVPIMGWAHVDSYTHWEWWGPSVKKPSFVNGTTVRGVYKGYSCRGFLCAKSGYEWEIQTWAWTVIGEETVNAGEYKTEYVVTPYYNPEQVQVQFETKPLSFKWKVKNLSLLYPMFIRKFHIRADVALRSSLNKTRHNYSPQTKKMFTYKALYIYSTSYASKLASSIYSYFDQASYVYTVKCYDDLPVGTWVLLTDKNFQNVNNFPVENKRCLIVSKKENDFTGEKTYTLEQYNPYEGA